MKRYIRSSVTSSKTVDDSNVKASTDNYNPYSFMVGDQLEWSGLYGGEYKGVVTDVTDEYITVDVMWIAEDSGKLVTNTRRFEIATDPEGRECIIVYRYRGTAGYVYPPSNSRSSKDATFKNDKRLSPTSERYKGYLIVLDRGGDGYNVYDKHRELEDAGYPSRDAAKKFIDELVADDNDIYSSTNSEYALFKKTYSHSREFKDKDKQSGSIRDLIDELENKDISYEIYDNKTDNGCTVFYDDDGTITASSEMSPRKLTYLESELANKSNDKRIYNAYQRGDLGIVQYGDVWYLEGGNVSKSLFEVIKREMATYFPELSYLHDIKASYGGAFDIEDDQYSAWKELASKSVEDSDGFYTDYTLYTDGQTYICMFGDKALYEPDASYADYETESEQDAWDWFNSYTGFADEEDEYDDILYDDILQSTEVLDSGYSPDLLNDLVNYYCSFDTMSSEEIWDEIVAEYNNEDLANDVLESLDHEEDLDLVDEEGAYDVYSSSDIRASMGRYDEYFGKTAAATYGDLIADRLRGKSVSKRRDTANEPGGLIYEANKLGIDMWDLLEALEGMCNEGRAREIDDSTYKILGASDLADEEDLPQADQEYDSAKTSINSNKLPAIYHMITLPEGSVGIDYGGGKFDNAVEALAEQGVTLYVYDPYNRSQQHNRAAIKALRANGGADFAINSNVLNVIKEPEARLNVLENIKKITKPGAPIYITVYEGSGKGNEGVTKSGYQLNRKTADYLEEIQQVFPNAKRKGKLIVATNSGSANSSTTIRASSTEGYVYTYCDKCGKKNRVKVAFNSFNEPFNDTEYKCKYCGTRNLLTDPHSYDENGNVVEASQSYLDRIEELMEQGLDEDTASREAYAEFYPDEYDADDYDEIYSANYGGAYYVEVNSTQRGTAPYEKKFSDFNSALSFAKKRGNSKTTIYIWDIPKEERSSNSVPNAVYNFDSGWQIIRPVNANEDRADDEIYSSTTSSSRYWYFTRHGVQPGSVPKYINILDIVDTPEGSYFLADGVILTDDLRNYEIKERKPNSAASRSISTKGETVEAGYYDIPEPPIDPPEDDSWTEVDGWIEDVDLDVDAIIEVLDDGSWIYEDETYPWAVSKDSHDGDHYSYEYYVHIGDPGTIVEDFDDVIEKYIPSEEGRYHLKCKATLKYVIEGVEVKQSDYYDEEVYKDNASVEFDEYDSKVENVSVERIW